jgi:hypothetical protein
MKCAEKKIKDSLEIVDRFRFSGLATNQILQAICYLVRLKLMYIYANSIVSKKN